MQRTEKRTFTEYLPVRPTRVQSATPMEATNNLRLDVSFDSHGRYTLAAVPCVAKDNGLMSCVISSFRYLNLEHAKRFNDGKLVGHAALVLNHWTERNYKETDTVVVFILKTLREFDLVLVTPYIDMDRAARIDAILARARKPCPTIVERFTLLGSDGNYYFANGFPLGVKAVSGEPTGAYVRRSEGFCFIDERNGTTYGTRLPTEVLKRRDWEDGEDGKAADFRSKLEEMSDSELESQCDYWLRYLDEQEETRRTTARAFAA